MSWTLIGSLMNGYSPLISLLLLLSTVGTDGQAMQIYFSAVQMIDADTGTAVGTSYNPYYGTILRTTDGGATWESQTSVASNDLYDLSFTDPNTGTVVGYHGTILHTTDGGMTWVHQTSGTTHSLYGVWFTDANTGTAVGYAGTILHTTDGGLNWTNQTSGTTVNLLDVVFTEVSVGTAVGAAGTILRTTDEGITWTAQTSGTTYFLNSVSFIDGDFIGTAVGDIGVIRRTTNGGSAWITQTSGTYDELNGVSVINENTAIAVGLFGTILRTTNGGLIWTRQINRTYVTLRGISMVDSSTGIAVGDEGIILRTTDGGTSWTSNQGVTTFINVQDGVGLNFTHQLADSCYLPAGSGSAWADYDNDGDIDLYITNLGRPSSLFRNEGDTNGDGLPDFTDVAIALGVDEEDLQSHGVVFADYDNDGDQDLYITHLGGNTLYQNRLIETGSPTFENVTVIAGVGDADRCITAAWADYDQDGWLDLYLAKHFDCLPYIRDSRDALFKNNGDGTFTNVSQYLCADHTLTCSQLNLSHASTAGWFDYDNDGDPDIYIASDVIAAGWANILWRNDGPDGLGGWTFTDVSEESGTGYSINTFGLGIGDYDNDGCLDLAFSHAEGGFLLRNKCDGTFEDVSVQAGVRRTRTPLGDVAVTWGTVFFDYDNDGWLDLFFVGGMVSGLPTPQPDVLFRNNHDGTFTDVSVETGIDDPRRGRSASICDFNQDGFVDLFVGNFGLPIDLYYNQSLSQGNTNHWLTITPQGGGTVNRDAIGTRFYLTTPDGITQTREITSGPTYGGGDHKVAYFGMGTNTAGTLTVHWPDGIVDSLGTVVADQNLHIYRLIEGVSEQGPVASEFNLFQNYPNPFNPVTAISYSVPSYGVRSRPDGSRDGKLTAVSQISLVVYDLLGREVATLVNEKLAPGDYTARWDATGQASGVYFYRLSTQSGMLTRKLVLLR